MIVSGQRFYGPVFGHVAGRDVHVHGAASLWTAIDRDVLLQEREAALAVARLARRGMWLNAATGVLLLLLVATLALGLFSLQGFAQGALSQMSGSTPSSFSVLACLVGLALAMQLAGVWAARIRRRARLARRAALEDVQSIDVELRRRRLLDRKASAR